MNRSEISEFMDKTCKPSFTGENDYYSRDKVLHIIMQLLNNGSKNSRLDGVSKPDFEECPECKSKDISATGFGSMSWRTKQSNEIFECNDCCHQFCRV